jgi:hypothetical protein
MPSAAGSRKMSTRKLPENRMMPEIDKMEAALSRALTYEELCLDQAEVIESLSSQVKRLLSAIEQYTDIEDEEAKYKQLEKRRSRF